MTLLYSGLRGLGIEAPEVSWRNGKGLRAMALLVAKPELAVVELRTYAEAYISLIWKKMSVEGVETLA